MPGRAKKPEAGAFRKKKRDRFIFRMTARSYGKDRRDFRSVKG